jgi:hypothetical protein
LYQISELKQLSPETKKLLGKLLKQGISELKPSLNKKGIQYIEIEKNLEDNDSASVDDILQELLKEGILEPLAADRVITCPDCNSPQVYSKYACPKCGAFNIDYKKWFEHTKCGYMGPEIKFMSGLSIVCPKCQAKFEEGVENIDFRKMGSIYECEKCGDRFDKPEIIHVCQQCEKNFDYQETKYIKIFAYKIADKNAKLSKELPLFESLGAILQERNFEIQFHTQLTGDSGVKHSFAVVAKRKQDSLVFDISLTGDSKDAISLLGKKTDVKPTVAILIDFSEGNELLQLGKTFGIPILKGGNEQQLESELDTLLASLD